MSKLKNIPYNFKAKNYMVFDHLITIVIELFILLLSIIAKFKPIRIIFVQVSIYYYVFLYLKHILN